MDQPRQFRRNGRMNARPVGYEVIPFNAVFRGQKTCPFDILSLRSDTC